MVQDMKLDESESTDLYWRLSSPEAVWERRVRMPVPDKDAKRVRKFIRREQKVVGHMLYDGENIDLFTLSAEELFFLFQRTQSMANAHLVLGEFRESLRWYLNTNECLESYIGKGGQQEAYYNIWLNFYRCGKVLLSAQVFAQMQKEIVWKRASPEWKYEVELHAALLHGRRSQLVRLVAESESTSPLWQGLEAAMMMARFMVEKDPSLLKPAANYLERVSQAKLLRPGIRTVNDDLYDLLLTIRNSTSGWSDLFEEE